MFSFVQFFTLRRQIILFALSLVAMVGLHMWVGFAASWIPALIVIFLLVKYFLLGTVNAAVMEMQMGNFEQAEKYLNWTKKPSWLRLGYHGVFYMLKSQFAFQRNDFENSEALAHKALKLDLQDDMKAGLYFQLINIYGQKKNINKVKEYYNQAKKLNITMPEIKMKLKEVEMMLEGKHPQQQQMVQQQRSRYSSPTAQIPFAKRGKR